MTLETHEIRRSGVRLRDAITRFASDELLEEFECALEPLKPPEFDEQKPLLSALSSFAFLAQTPSLEKAKAEQQARIQTALRAHLKFWLETGELAGYANQAWPTPTRSIRKIPIDFWLNAEIDWISEIAKDAARVYQRILIIDPEDFPGRELFPAMGPKYFANEICEAMAELQFELPNFISSEMPHKVRAFHVRNWIKRKYQTINVDGRGFDVDTIRRHYKRHCLSAYG